MIAMLDSRLEAVVAYSEGLGNAFPEFCVELWFGAFPQSEIVSVIDIYGVVPYAMGNKAMLANVILRPPVVFARMPSEATTTVLTNPRWDH